MKNIEKNISPLIQSQFPAFYREQGPFFVLFVEEYFKWLEENNSTYASYDDTVADGNVIYHIRRLLEYRDIDRTLESFIIYFKEKYLKGVVADTNISQRKLVKAAQDLFTSKGSERAFDLFFKLVFGVKVEVYTPGDNILKASDGTWILPKYLEITKSSRTTSFINKQILGSSSGATAFVEFIITRNINGKLIDILFLSNLKGNFETNEIVTEYDNTIIENAPKVIGSLTSVSITLAGELFEQGEEVLLTSSTGVEGIARVTEIDSVTGIVRFSITDGGWGYSTTANTFVSEKVLAINNVTNSNTSITNFQRYEIVTQNVYSFNANNITGTLSNNVIIVNGNTSTQSESRSITVSQNTSSPNTANIILGQISGNVFSNVIIYEKNKAIIATNNNVIFSRGDILQQRDTGASSNTTLGIVDIISNVTIFTVNATSIGSNGLHVGTYLKQQTSGASGIITMIPRENFFTHTNVSHIAVGSVSGTFTNTYTINVYNYANLQTQLGTFTANEVVSGKQYELIETNQSTNTRWSYNNTAIVSSAPTINAVVLIASDIGGTYYSYTDKSPTANLIGSNTTSLGLLNVANTFYPSIKVVGQTSNTRADVTAVYSGFGADFSIGNIENAEIVRLSPDLINDNNDAPGTANTNFKIMLISGANSKFNNLSSVCIFSGGTSYNNTDIVTFSGGNTGVGSYTAGNASIITDASGIITAVTLSANVGNLIITTPTISITNATGGATTGSGANLIAVSSLGFPKLPAGDITYRIYDLLRFETKTIGTISSLTGINPGENYTSEPFAIAYEPLVAAYGKKDIILETTITSGPGFSTGENITQTISTPGITLVANGYSGNTSNNFEVGEYVYVRNAGANVANGYVYSSSFDGTTNNITVIVTGNNGTYGIGNTITGLTSNLTATIRSTSAYTGSALARGIVKSGSNTTYLPVKRISLFTEFSQSGTLVGISSGTQATIVSAISDNNSNTIGDNAIISANVVSSEGSIISIDVFNSGYGFEHDQEITISSLDGLREASGKANVAQQGIGRGYYSSTRGFLDNDMFIFDGYYYQNFSYELQTSIPFDKYASMLTDLLHVAGKKMFGRVLFQPVANLDIETISTSEQALSPSLDLNFERNDVLDSRITFTRASNATYYDIDGILRTATSNVARFDRDPITRESLGLLIEEQRTNLVLQSDDFANVAWLKLRSSITSNTIVAPDGTLTGDKAIPNTDNNTHLIYAARTGSNETLTWSVFAKAGEVPGVRLALSNFSTADCGAFFNLTTGVVTSISVANADYTNPSASMIPVGNGWYRCIFTVTKGTVNSTNNPTVQLIAANGTSVSFAGDGYSGIYIWGAQLEAGAFPTSYIATGAATATRSADAASMTGTNFSSWYNQSEGTLFVDGLPQKSNIAAQSLFDITDGTSNTRIGLIKLITSGIASFAVRVSGVNEVVTDNGEWTFPGKLAGAYKVNDFAAVLNGTTVATDTSGAIPVVNRLDIGWRLGGVSPTILNGHIRRIAYYPLRLTNAQLQALTT